MKYSGLLILILCLFAFSCKTNEAVSPDDFEGSRLILSHGGGFAGTYTTYCLLENGQVFKNAKHSKTSKNFEANIPVQGFDKNIATQMFSNYYILGLDKEKVESYDNLNYSITMINEKGEEHKLIWGANQKGAEKLRLFYNIIMNQIKVNNAKEASTQKVQ